MRIKSIAESPFQHMYSGVNPYPSTGVSATSKQTRKMMSEIVFPTYKACGTDESRRGKDFSFQPGFVEGCLQYSKDIPGSFNFNYDALTGGND